MLVIFKSKAAADVIMYGEHARRILDLLHKDVRQGIITAAETAGAIAAIEAEIRTEQAEHADDEENASQYVRFATRAFPFLEMLRAAHKRGKDVVWGV
jgi:hypothetical protein